MSADELLQVIWEYCRTNTKETIETVNELIAQITDNPKQLAYDLSERLEEWSLERGYCPLCGENIVQLGRNTQSSEYFGQPVEEIENIYGCDNPSCGYIKE
jgi:hypothetical protein